MRTNDALFTFQYWRIGRKVAINERNGYVEFLCETQARRARGSIDLDRMAQHLLYPLLLAFGSTKTGSEIFRRPATLPVSAVGHTVKIRTMVARDGDLPLLFVVLKEGAGGSPALAAELVEFCRKGLAPYKYPRQVNFVTVLPKTATGKIQRFVLRSGLGKEPAKTRAQ